MLALGGLAAQHQRDLQERVAAIARSGAPITAVQLGEPKVPDAENAALVYQKAFEALTLSRADEDLLQKVVAAKASLGDPAVLEQVARSLHANQAALALIERASRMPRCQFPVDWSAGVNATFPHWAKLRKCARLVGARARLLARQGRPDDALATCATLLRISEAPAQEPTLISQFVLYSIIGITFDVLQDVLNDRQPSAKACRRLSDRIAKIDITPSFVATLKGERAMSLSLFDKLARSRAPRLAAEMLLMGECAEEEEPVLWTEREKGRAPTLVRLLLATNALAYLDVADRAIELAPLPYREAVRAKPSPEEVAEKSVSKGWPPRTLAAILAPGRSLPSAARDAAAARLSLARVALELRAYRAAHGSYPASLAQLQTALATALPADPFTGHPLSYGERGQGFLLYSWGPDLKDNGGTPQETSSRGPGDIVFRMTR